jgi:hypothetical protein
MEPEAAKTSLQEILNIFQVKRKHCDRSQCYHDQPKERLLEGNISRRGVKDVA